mgnify:CR=1 FL=1
MEVIDRISYLCKERGMSVSALEKELEFSNGSLAKAKDIPSSRILEISEYFNVPMNWIMTGKEPEFDKYGAESAHLVAKIRNDAGLTQALEKYFELSDKKKKHVIELINLLSEE